MVSDNNDYPIRLALAAHAHDTGQIRLEQRDLRGFAHIAASRQGLFAVRPDGCCLIAHGQFYGITIDRDAIYVFEACGHPRERGKYGRILKLSLRGGQVEHAEVVVRGLDNGGHQLDLIGGDLYLTDTYNQQLLQIAPDGTIRATIQPLPPATGPADPAYAHVNSLLGFGGRFYLLKHNNSQQSGRNSEVAVFDRHWRLLETLPLAGQACHNLALLGDGGLISCGSLAGEIIGPGRAAIKVCERMTRGLSVSADQIVVGGSALLGRDQRDLAPGEVYFLDASFRRQAVVAIPGPVMEIRRIDGRDRSLSAHLGEF